MTLPPLCVSIYDWRDDDFRHLIKNQGLRDSDYVAYNHALNCLSNEELLKRRYLVEIIEAPFFERNGMIFLDGEHHNSFHFCDYYGEFRGGYPWISDVALQWAADRGGFWEWQNPGCLLFIKN